MLTLKRILCPTDFSPPSEAALDTAIELARRFDADLELFHAQDLPAYVFPDGVLPVSPEILSSLESAAAKELDRLAERARSAGVRITTASAFGANHVEILRRADETHADLIVMGTHGRTGLAHVLLGSVAERVVRRARCPVLTVRSPQLQAEPHP
jgi:nucleotide-binding universal stress UspA family protein